MTPSTARRLSFLMALVTVLWAAPIAQERRTLSPDDYGRWEQLVPRPAPLSPDGQWLVGATLGKGWLWSGARVDPGEGK